MSKVSIKTRVIVLYEVVIDVIRQNLPISMLVVGVFTIGYAVKNVEDAQDRQRAHEALSSTEKAMGQECEARILDVQNANAKQMKERDGLLADQTQRIADQTQRLKDQGLLMQVIADRQAASINFSHRELTDIKSAATAAKIEAKNAAIVASKGVTEKDRQTINSKVQEKAK